MRIKGTFFVLLVLAVLLIFSGCDTNGSAGGPLFVEAVVETDDAGSTAASVMMSEGGLIGTPVTDATVTVNGTQLTYGGVLLFWGLYAGAINPAVAAGESVTLEIQRGSVSISATLQMPVKPMITAPAGGDQSEPVEVSWTWTPITDPDQFQITVDSDYRVGSEDYTGYATGTTRSHSIPTGTFDTSKSEAYVEVSAINRTTSLGSDAAAGAEFDVGNTEKSPPFNPEP